MMDCGKFFITTRHRLDCDAARHVATNAREPAEGTRGWAGNPRPAVFLGRALAALGTAPTENAVANLAN